MLNVGFGKVCSGTCVVCGLSAGDLDCLVFNRAFFAVTILVNATWTGKMIIIWKIVFHEIKFNPNLILTFFLLYDNLMKLWTIDKQISDIKEKASKGKTQKKFDGRSAERQLPGVVWWAPREKAPKASTVFAKAKNFLFFYRKKMSSWSLKTCSTRGLSSTHQRPPNLHIFWKFMTFNDSFQINSFNGPKIR